VAAALKEAGTGASRQLQAVAEVFDRRLADPNDLQALHQKIGLLAQDSVQRSYDQVVTAREGWAGRQHYRAGATDWHTRRFANKVLRKALGDAEFFEATADGIDFVNVDFLNRKAAQWHRLNFGAGSVGGGSGAHFQITWGTVVSASLGYDEPESAAFVLPRGIFMGPEGPVPAGAFAPGSDMFYPSGEAKAAGLPMRNQTRRVRMTRGIEARNFLDAGLRRIARELPVGYGQLYREWWGQAQTGAGPLTQVSSVVPARPVTLRARVRRL
jgi:hypothetical protein